jgi:hercynylcysteine S-oxide lyase
MLSIMAEPAIPFGREMREKHFSFDPAYTPLNHGSYGTFPNIIRDYMRELQDLAAAQPDTFIRYNLPELLIKSREAIAPLLGVAADEVVFVPNATTGVNTVLRNLVYGRGDVILHFSTIYGACEKTISSICETSLAESVCIELQYPIEDEAVVRKFYDMVETVKRGGRTVKVAMFDTVLTFPGVRMPWEALVTACKDLAVLSLVDGAHGVGHIDLTNLGKVGPDFFTSNCYK